MAISQTLPYIMDFLTSGALFSEDSHVTIARGNPTRSPSTGSFYKTDFFLNEPCPWRHYPHQQTLPRAELIHVLQKLAQAPKLAWRRQDLAPFDQAFHDLQTQRLVKVVPYIFDQADNSLSLPHLAYCMQNLLQQKKLYIYGLWDPAGGILGATPELLYRQKGLYVETMACAGTAPLDGTSLMGCSKNQREHDLVVQYIQQQLAPLGELSVAAPCEIGFPGLKHLITTITLQLREPLPPTELLKRLHPTPALGAAPYVQGKQWLAAYEKSVPRHSFGAPFVYHDSQQTCSVVAIRNMQWTPRKIMIGAGCGVIPQSILHQEREELFLKLAAIKQMLGVDSDCQ